MSQLITPVILTGGSGTRLWPVSRDSMPKQFLPLFGEHSTYQQALLRVSNKNLFATPIVLTSEEFRFFSRQQAEDVGVEAHIVLEPLRRDSGPAIVAAALIASKMDPKASVVVLAADHLIPDTGVFEEACRAAHEIAQRGYIVTFGIPPTQATGRFGYICRGEQLLPHIYAVKQFVEKPDPQTAQRYIEEGYLWNSGIFFFEAETLLAEVKQFEPTMFSHVRQSVEGATSDLGFTRLWKEAFSQATQKSIDYAVMEKSSKVAVVEAAFEWADVGSWEGLYQYAGRDEQGNAARGRTVLVDTEGTLVHTEVGVTAVLGVKDIIVITTPDAVLVASRDRAEDVKKLVAEVQKQGHKEAREHRRIYRPWGYYESVDVGERFQVKRIVVLPNAKLSLQKHLHRAEHWVVVRGVAEVTIGESVRVVHENESVYVPMETIHRLCNPGKIPLELIEVQTGSYLGEDDIERLEDIYKR